MASNLEAPGAPAERITSTTSTITDYAYPYGHLGHLTQKQEEAFLQFKKVLEERGLLKPGPPPSHDDPLILRYLRARRWDVEGAYTQFKETEDWRKANDLDTLYDTIDLSAYDFSRRLYPQWTGRRDRRGIPLYVFEVKTLDSKTVHEYEKVGASSTFSQAKSDGKTPNGLLRLFALYENLTRFNMPFCTQLLDREHPEVPITLSTNIVDISGVGLKQFWNLKQHMQAASQLATAHYPETLDRIFVIGAPAFFSTVWGWVKRWFDPITVSKIFILGSHEVKSVLEQYVEPKNIPKKYGGQLDYSFGQLGNPDPNWEGVVVFENGHTTFPSGPLLWEEEGNDRLVCVAKGSKDGKVRNERICTIPKTFGLAPEVQIAGVNAPVDAPVDAVPNGTAHPTEEATHSDGVQTDESLLSNDVNEKLKLQEDKPAAPQTTTA
ncbi:CRAL-TRIO domain-containing protein [Fusarium flagelliforme]|uniref:Cellular retinaldehyde-binding/triple function n=1 Tax=Fusarium flagelliforme TaxID=2675880 RepID=A0A395N3L2_9HYPO|nr:CRAL-TRIO domain-containing protein [Fusarium flagelliforme]KAH7182540.1 CRAL-TRIO domain-containing protein [Fusarium flagelliforme]RFN54701.1 cellular retinaldehyde-binding/triple function [Fusarium flagelliforme]